MHLKKFRIQNFRRLHDVAIDVDPETTVFVGANNTGKTSATQIFRRFLGDDKGKFQIFDFTAECWAQFDALDATVGDPLEALPRIVLDLWFDVEDSEIHRVMNFIPGLFWDNRTIGVRLQYMPRNPESLIATFEELRTTSRTASAEAKLGPGYLPWPATLTDYLTRELVHQYHITYAALDPAHSEDADYTPEIARSSSGHATALDNLIRVDFLDAQRHLADRDVRGRTENLSRRLSDYYAHNLRQRDSDHHVLAAIAKSEESLNDHFGKEFSELFEGFTALGCADRDHARLTVKASFDPQGILRSGGEVHYILPVAEGEASFNRTLPDQYNGLGFKNLIYMIVEIADFAARWRKTRDDRPPVHLVMIEEPETHLHAQLQQVFIERIRKTLKDDPGFRTQMIVTTHSPHIIYGMEFDPIRYFKRVGADGNPRHSEVKNLLSFRNTHSSGANHDFLRRYLNLTHCDLFFADAAILVEGTVERLLLPQIIRNEVSDLTSRRLTILEVGGSFAQRFRDLVAFLGIPTLVITDLDSVQGPRRNACMTTEPAARTANATLSGWMPGLSPIEALLDAPDDAKSPPAADHHSPVRVAYQTRDEVTWEGITERRAGRTFEESFALRNLAWCQQDDQQDLGLCIAGHSSMPLPVLHQQLYERVRDLHKTEFALALIGKDAERWEVPSYILDGLIWLRGVLPQETETAA